MIQQNIGICILIFRIMRVQGGGDCVAAEIDFYGLSPIGTYCSIMKSHGFSTA